MGTLSSRDLANRLRYEPAFDPSQYTIGDTTSPNVLQEFRKFYDTIHHLDINTWMSVYAPHLLIENLNTIKKGPSHDKYRYQLSSLSENIWDDVRIFYRIFKLFHPIRSAADWDCNQPFISGAIKDYSNATLYKQIAGGNHSRFLVLRPIVSFLIGGFPVSFYNNGCWCFKTEQNIPAHLFDIIPDYLGMRPRMDPNGFAKPSENYSYAFENKYLLYTFCVNLHLYNISGGIK